jgi:hypothetical protein
MGYWSAVATELACFALARKKGKRLMKIIDTKKLPMPQMQLTLKNPLVIVN